MIMIAPRLLRLLLAVVVLLMPLSAFAATPKLATPPEGERWFSISVSDERVGFAHTVIARTGDGYRIDSDGTVKMRVMGFSREASYRETYLVGNDLAIRSFSTENVVNGKPILLKGEAVPQGLRVIVDSEGKKKNTVIKAKGAVYPSQALNIYPLMRGPLRGKTYKIPMLDPESAKVKQIKVEVAGEETLQSGTPAVHLKNNLYPMVDNDVWVDLKGNTIKESVRDDLVLTLAEDEKSARMYLAGAALSRKEPVFGYSVIHVEPPLDRPEQLKKLALEIAGVPGKMPLLQGKGQQVTRLPDGRVVFTMPNPAYAPAAADAPTAADLQATPRINSDAPEIAAQKGGILTNGKDPEQAVKLLVQWVAKEIKVGANGTQSSLEALKSRSGSSQGHALLYTALARANKIPTRMVSGVTYAPGQGFVYHCWAESYLNGGWVAVDPTLGEAPADVTHIKLVQGDAPEDIGALAGLVGRLQAKVLQKQ